MEPLYGCQSFLVVARADSGPSEPVYRITAGHCLPWAPPGGLALADNRVLFAQNPTDDGQLVPWTEMANMRDLALFSTPLTRAQAEAKGLDVLSLPVGRAVPEDLWTFNSDRSEVALDTASIKTPISGFRQIWTEVPIEEGASGSPVYSKASRVAYAVVSASDFDQHILATTLEGLNRCFDGTGTYNARLPLCPISRFK